MISISVAVLLAVAQPPRPETRTYDVTPAVKVGRNAEDIGKAILGIFEPKSKPRVVVRENNLIELEGTAKQHGEVKDLLESLRHLADIAVDVKTELIELDADAFEKSVLPLMKKGIGVITTEQAKAVAKAGTATQSSSARRSDGGTHLISARQKLISRESTVGYKLEAEFRVAPDRRSVHAELREQVFSDMRQPLPGSPGFPGSSGSADVPDGGAIAFKLEYAPRGKVWVVVVHTTIFIGAEAP